MQFISVKSSTIAQIGLDINQMNSLNARPMNVLRIVFTSGNIFDYYEVEKEIFEAFLEAESMGKFFHEFIKDKYQYEKVSK